MDQKQHSRITRLRLRSVSRTSCASFSEPASASKDKPPYARDWGITTDAGRLPPADLQPVVGQLTRSPGPGRRRLAVWQIQWSPLIRMFTRLHHVCTRIPGKVQMKKMPILVVIVVSKRDIQRYVLIRVFIYTISRERRARPQEWVTPPRVPMKSAVVQRYVKFRRVRV